MPDTSSSDLMPQEGHPADPARYRAAQRSTWVSVVVNLVLTVAQIVVGLLAHAQSLVADGMHSLSDLLADFLVLYANRKGAHPADPQHPYGHGRIETVTSFVLGAGLVVTGALLLWSAGSRLQQIGAVPEIKPIALWVALGTLVAKEGLFRYMLAVAERVRSPMLVANAWHARSDAASSLVVAVGIGGSLMGFAFADLLAAALVAFMIVRMGARFAYDAIQELIDTALDDESVAGIRATLKATPGVAGLHELRTRRMAHQALVDAHVQVDPRISVSEGHRIAELARARVLAEHRDVLDVLVHVDAENDADPRSRQSDLPGRTEVEARIVDWLADITRERPRVVLHYLAGRIEAEVHLATQLSPGELARAARTLEARRQTIPSFGAISLYCRVDDN